VFVADTGDSVAQKAIDDGVGLFQQGLGAYNVGFDKLFGTVY
jgi:hypothetical protein